MLADQVAVQRIVLVAEEGLRATIAALGDVMRMPREYRACQPCHWRLLLQARAEVN